MSKNVKVNGHECSAVFKDENGNKMIKIVSDDGCITMFEYTGHVDEQITFDVFFKSDSTVVLSDEFKELLREEAMFNIGDKVKLIKENFHDSKDYESVSKFFDKTLYIVRITDTVDTPRHFVLATVANPTANDEIVSFNDNTVFGFIKSEIELV